MTMLHPYSTTNAFCTARIRPGAVPYIFPDGKTIAQLARKFTSGGRAFQIVGPHGTGKSTLLESLIPEWEALGEDVEVVTLGNRARRWLLLGELGLTATSSLLVIDGCEQLSFLCRRLLFWQCQRRGLGLLVTTHRDLGLPTLYRTQVDEPLAWQVVEKLVGKSNFLVSRNDVAPALAATDGNLREALFRLYDVYEFRRREALGPAPA